MDEQLNNRTAPIIQDAQQIVGVEEQSTSLPFRQTHHQTAEGAHTEPNLDGAKVREDLWRQRT